jgi:hypothetical protein
MPNSIHIRFVTNKKKKYHESEFHSSVSLHGNRTKEPHFEPIATRPYGPARSIGSNLRVLIGSYRVNRDVPAAGKGRAEP